MKAKTLYLLLAVFFSSISVFANSPIEEGKTIFSTRCAGCHNINKILTGPALSGIHERRSMDWIISFVRSSQTMIKSGDKEAITLFEKFNRIPMPDHSDLSDENIKNIVEYIKTENKGTNVAADPLAKPAKLKPDTKPLSLSDYGYIVAFTISISLLIGSIWALIKVKQYQRKHS